jgi:hypothetical protein
MFRPSRPTPTVQIDTLFVIPAKAGMTHSSYRRATII